MKQIFKANLWLLVISATIIITAVNVSAKETWIDDICYSYFEQESYATITGASDVKLSAEEWTIPASINVEGINFPIKKISSQFTAPGVKTIKAPKFISEASYYSTFPNLECFTITDNEKDFFTKDGLVYYHNSFDDSDNLVFLPPAKDIKKLRIESNTNYKALDGNKYLKRIQIVGKGTISYMNYNEFPELEEFEIEGESEWMKIIDGALYYTCFNHGREDERYSFIGYPLKRGDVCIINEKTQELTCGIPNVKTVIVDSPRIKLNSGKLGCNIENIIFTRPTDKPKEWKLYDLCVYQLRPTVSIWGENLKHVELPENISFNPYIFSNFEFQYSTNNGTKRYYRVTFSPKLEYVKGGSIRELYWPDSGKARIAFEASVGGHIASDFYVLPSSSATVENGFVEPTKSMEIHVKDPSPALQGSNSYIDIDNLPKSFEIYYDSEMTFVPKLVSRCAAGLNIKCESSLADGYFSEFPRLKILNINFGDNFSGLGTSHFGGLFKGGNGFVSIDQLNTDGTVSKGQLPPNLSKVNFYGKIINIPYGYFSNFTGLKSLSLPEAITSLSDRSLYGCSGLTEMKVYADYPPATYPETFIGVRKALVNLSVPEKAIDLYKKDNGWRDFFFAETHSGLLTVKKSIERAGEINVNFDGELGTYANIKASPNENYKFICWLDGNGFFISGSPEFDLKIDTPSTLTAVFMPDAESEDVVLNLQSDGSLQLIFPDVDGAVVYRATAYLNELNGRPIAKGETSVTANANIFGKAYAPSKNEIVLNGLESDLTYSILIEAFDSNTSCLEARWKKANMSTLGVGSITSSPEYHLSGNLLTLSGENVQAGVWSITGYCLFSGKINGDSKIKLDAGVYVIRIADRTAKILVR